MSMNNKGVESAVMNSRLIDEPMGREAPVVMPVAMGQLTEKTDSPDKGEACWWFDACGLNESTLLAAVERSNCTHVVISLQQQDTFHTKKQIVVRIERSEDLSKVKSGAWVFTASEEIRSTALKSGRKVGLYIEVEDLEKEFSRCVEICERGDHFVVIDIKDATYIPYELLVAKTEGKPTQVLRSVPIKRLNNVVDDIDQSLNAFATLERGIGVLYRVCKPEAIRRLSKAILHRQAGKLNLVHARVEEVQHTGLGHRVCVDTTSMLTAKEGFIVGSTGWGGLFVCSETHYLPHMNLREFRVNAGAVHSYIWGACDQVHYLSEMAAGSEVVCVNSSGDSRVVTVGRAKIERRPLLKIRCSISLDQAPADVIHAVEKALTPQKEVTPSTERLSFENCERVYINAFLQNDWHVRIMGADGKIRHSTLVQPGDELLAHVTVPGRHTGLRITESIIER